MDGASHCSIERSASSWLSERAQGRIWWTLVAFAVLDWSRPQLALTQEWWFVLLVLWIVPWQRSTKAESSFTRTVTWISSLVLFAWLVSRTEHAVRESVNSWVIFRSSTESKLLSHAWRATLATFVTSLAIGVPLRRVVGAQTAKTAAVLACLPYSLRLAGHLFSLSLKSLAIPIALYEIAILPLTMATILRFLQRFQLSHERIPGYQHARTWGYRVLKGQLNPFGGVFVLYAGFLAMTLWLTASWIVRGVALPVRAPASLLDTLAFPWIFSGLVLSSVALWRCLGRGAPRNIITENIRTVARALVVVSLVPVALAGFFLGLPYSAEVISETVQESGGPAWSVTPSDTGQEIYITGEIGPGLADALAEALEATPGVERVELESPGGSVSEGLALAELVQKYALDTVVSTYCDSSCTLVFVAGADRVLESGGELGFHRCRSTLWFYSLLYDDEHNADLARYLRTKGVSKAFVDKVISVPSAEIWYPSVDQLLAAGVMTATAGPETETDAPRRP